ncbi:hypothetical protein EDC27_0587 [Desulfosoma caldarium]|uniref:Uncharacterized protein n=1 Tax=Desulfosoma caldarium TaxID=610254 RepID=A0A3N1VMM6_9BACT|nr:hypothetical protein EDC27_0587 [Desulfosoma caldarium]
MGAFWAMIAGGVPLQDRVNLAAAAEHRDGFKGIVGGIKPEQKGLLVNTLARAGDSCRKGIKLFWLCWLPYRISRLRRQPSSPT